MVIMSSFGMPSRKCDKFQIQTHSRDHSISKETLKNSIADVMAACGKFWRNPGYILDMKLLTGMSFVAVHGRVPSIYRTCSAQSPGLDLLQFHVARNLGNRTSRTHIQWWWFMAIAFPNSTCISNWITN